jgi:hypothetical protein
MKWGHSAEPRAQTGLGDITGKPKGRSGRKGVEEEIGLGRFQNVLEPESAAGSCLTGLPTNN